MRKLQTNGLAGGLESRRGRLARCKPGRLEAAHEEGFPWKGRNIIKTNVRSAIELGTHVPTPRAAPPSTDTSHPCLGERYSRCPHGPEPFARLQRPSIVGQTSRKFRAPTLSTTLARCLWKTRLPLTRVLRMLRDRLPKGCRGTLPSPLQRVTLPRLLSAPRTGRNQCSPRLAR